MNLLLILPITIPLLAAAGSLLAWRWPCGQRWLGLLSTSAMFLVALVVMAVVRTGGIQTVQIGDWPAPYGITLVADLFTSVMLVLSGLMGLSVAIYGAFSMDARREQFGYHVSFQILLMGVNGAFLTGDLFNLYVWFEVMLVASFVLMALGGERAQLEGAIKYVALNLIASAIFLAAVGLLYGIAGTLNIADLAVKLKSAPPEGLVSAVSILFLGAFGIKAAVFPLFFWLPASYHTPPVAVSAIFAGLLTKVGVYAMIRVFSMLFVHDIAMTHGLILAVAGLTMVTGVFGAVVQNEFRRILSFHIVSQIGYMVLGLGLFTPLALAGSIFYIAHHIVVKTNLFLVSGMVYRACGTYELSRLGGLYRSHPFLGVLFLIPALSLAGLPPLSGFFAKLILVRAGLEDGQYVVVGAALFASLLTLYSMIKIWNEAFWKDKDAPDAKPSQQERAIAPVESMPVANDGKYQPVDAWLFVPVVALALTTVTIGIAAEPLFQIAQDAAYQLLDPDQYITKVLAKE